MTNEIWEGRRKQLETELKNAALALFEHASHAGAFMLPLAGENLFIAAGTKPEMLQLLGFVPAP